MLAALRKTIERHAMFAPEQTVVVGVSGGPDSSALLHALVALNDTRGLKLVVAHFHHGFRGEEADADADYVRDLARLLGVPFRLERADVPGRRRRLHLSAQQAARDARHAFLRRVADEERAERIALAHTRDDRIESVLLNLFRGTGLEGLQGFPPVALPLVRPLYDTTRAEVEAYCAAHDLQPRLDSSNVSLVYRRNRLRAELLPYLRTYFSEKVDDAIARMSDLAAADNTLLESLAAKTFGRAVRQHSSQELLLTAHVLKSEPVSLQRRVLRQAVAQMRGHLHNIEFALLERIRDSMVEGTQGAFDLPEADGITVRVIHNGETLRFIAQSAPAEPVPFRVALRVPGRTELPYALGVVETYIAENGGAAAAWQRRQPEEASTVLFRKEEVRLPLIVRSWRPGDRMRLRGLSGSKKLQDLFTDAKIPFAERRRLPILVEENGEGRLLAVLGYRACESALTEEETRIFSEETLVVTYKPAGK